MVIVPAFWNSDPLQRLMKPPESVIVPSFVNVCPKVIAWFWLPVLKLAVALANRCVVPAPEIVPPPDHASVLVMS